MELPGSVVSADWLSEHTNNADLALRVVDSRWYMDGRSGHEAFLAGHIPGAVFVDLDTDLSGPPSQPGGRHPLPRPQDFAASMAAAGIGDDSTVVVYDDAAGGIAARLWWMLTTLGVSAAILDGGLATWTGPLTSQPSTPTPAAFTPQVWPADAVATGDHVAACAANTVVIDARDAGRFAGKENSIDPRFGHIPGAASGPWQGNLNAQGLLSSSAELRSHYESLGVEPTSDIITYCGSGVTACHNILALQQLGLKARLYVGSWSEWGADSSRPLEQ